MKDLFTLNDYRESGSTETSNIFSQLSEDVNVVGAQKDKQDKHKPLRASARHADGVAVQNDSKSEISTSGRKGKEKADNSDGDVDEETNILRSLFDAHGIHVSLLNAILHNPLCPVSVLLLCFLVPFFDGICPLYPP